eukprot:1230180-Amphidinium_carterae.1
MARHPCVCVYNAVQRIYRLQRLQGTALLRIACFFHSTDFQTRTRLDQISNIISWSVSLLASLIVRSLKRLEAHQRSFGKGETFHGSKDRNR